MKRFLTLKTNLTDVEGVRDAPGFRRDIRPDIGGYTPVLETMKRFVTLDPIIVKGNYGITEGGLTAADPEVVDGVRDGVWTGGFLDNSPASYINSPTQHAYVKIGQVPLYAITIKHEPIKYEAMRKIIGF